MSESTKLVPREPEPTALDRPAEVSPPHSYNYGVDPNAENEIHLLDYWRAIRKRLWLVIGLVVLVTMLAVIYMAQKPDIYQAEARVQVDLESNAAWLVRRLTLWARLTIPSISIPSCRFSPVPACSVASSRHWTWNTILTSSKGRGNRISMADCETNGGPQGQRKG